MKTKFLQQTIQYDGTQLRSHFIYEKTGILGNCLIAFQGSCDVPLPAMVDQVDVRNREPIYSESMLHFMGEFFGFNLSTTVFVQRLLMVGIMENILKLKPKLSILRQGDDLYVGKKKLSVSIATVTPVSTVLHAGLNISSQNTPVPTIGLKDLKISTPILAKAVLKAWEQEFASVQEALVKVRAVP